MGRRADQQICVEDPGLSREHAKLLFGPPGARLVDLCSHNGTYLNGERIRAEAPFKFGDVVRCGNTLLMPVADVGAYRDWPHMARQGPLLGGAAMEVVRRKIQLLAREGIEVLIRGESGTGKDVAACLLHQHGNKGGAFVPVNCAAMPEALFEAELFGARKGAYTGAAADRPGLMASARGGTLFLDEVGELPPGLQPKLLRAVELREVRPLGADRPVRLEFTLVAATNRNLEQEVAADRFREDLYHRLCGATIELPPLRRRCEDIVLFAERAMAEAGRGDEQPLSMSAQLMERLVLYEWPGNVRELQRTIRECRIQALLESATELRPSHLRAAVLQRDGGKRQVTQLVQAMRQAGGNVSSAAVALGLSRAQVYNRLKAQNLRAEDFR